MRIRWRMLLAVVGLLTSAGVSVSSAQTGSLGGFGARMNDPAVSGPMIPYAGQFGGFMPYRGGGSGLLTFQPRVTSSMGSSTRMSFSLTPMSAGMGPAFGAGPRLSAPFGMSGGMGMGGINPTSAPRGMSAMPPNFGYPFRQPPSLLSPATAGSGMSM